MAVAGPSFLCSSQDCKTLTKDIMGVVAAFGAGTDDSDAASIEQAAGTIGGIEWCPAEDVAGYTYKQSFVFSETIESFTEEKQVCREGLRCYSS